MEPLIEIHRSKWPELRDLYRNKWPDDVVPFRILDNHITHPDLVETFNFKVFAPEGDIRYGFVAMSGQDSNNELMIHPLISIDKIERVLLDTKIINWNEGVISSASPVVEECFRRLEKLLGIKLKIEGNKAFIHFLDRDSKQFDISNNPPDTYVDELKPEYLDIVNKTWTFYSESSYKFFEALFRNHLSYALYSTKDDALLAWVTISCEGSLTHLYCQEEHRRKGYAEYILKIAANDQLNNGNDVLGFTLEKNVKAQKLFDKLCFKRTGYNTWIYFNKE